MRTFKHFCAVMIVALLMAVQSNAQKTMDGMQLLTVNENITTVITASEPVRFVDISTDKVVGDQPINNTIRLKPKEGVEVNRDGDILAVVTIVTERYRSQYALIYTSHKEEAVTDKAIEIDERVAYNNPAVSMSTEDMARYARKIWSSPARYRNVSTKQHRMTMRLNNIYSVGEYFFLDFSALRYTRLLISFPKITFDLSFISFPLFCQSFHQRFIIISGYINLFMAVHKFHHTGGCQITGNGINRIKIDNG